MICAYLRSSSVQSYEICPFMYFINYVLGHKDESGKAAVLGTAVHKVLEVLANYNLCLKNGKQSFQDDDIGEVKCKDIYDITELEDIKKRVYQHYERSDFTNSDKNAFNMCINTALQSYFDPRSINVIAAERFFSIDVNEPWATIDIYGKKTNLKIRGTIDLITEPNKDTIEIVDWKTGKSKISWSSGKQREYEDFYNDFQLRLYHYAVSILYPEYDTIASTIFFLRINEPITVVFNKSDIEKTKEIIMSKFLRIKNDNKPQLKNNRNHWFCERVCWYNKNRFYDTNESYCEYLYNHAQKYGIESTIKNKSNKDFDISKYTNQ